MPGVSAFGAGAIGAGGIVGGAGGGGRSSGTEADVGFARDASFVEAGAWCFEAFATLV